MYSAKVGASGRPSAPAAIRSAGLIPILARSIRAASISLSPVPEGSLSLMSIELSGSGRRVVGDDHVVEDGDWVHEHGAELGGCRKQDPTSSADSVPPPDCCGDDDARPLRYLIL